MVRAKEREKCKGRFRNILNSRILSKRRRGMNRLRDRGQGSRSRSRN